MSGFTDSIRERRTREIRFGDGWEEETTKTTAPKAATRTTLGLLVVQRLVNLEDQEEAIRKVLEGRLDIDYFRWNGRTDNDVLIDELINGGIIGLC
jgi:hypothetical protein